MLHDFEDGRGLVPAHQHPTGGGWVADTATVDPDSTIEGSVRGSAIVSHSTIDKDSTVYGGEIRKSSLVNSSTTITTRLDVCEVENSCIEGQCAFSKIGDSYIGSNIKASNSNFENCELHGKGIFQHSILMHCNQTGKAEVVHTIMRSGSLNLDDDVYLHGSILQGSIDIFGHTNALNSEIEGNWEIVDTGITNAALSGHGSLANCKIKKGKLTGSLCLRETEVRDEAELTGGDGAVMYCCFVYEQAKVTVLAGTIEDSEFFGKANVTLNGNHRELYQYV